MSNWIISSSLAVVYLIIGIAAARLLPQIVGAMVVSAVDARTSAGLSERRRDTLQRLAKHLTLTIILVVCGIFTLSLFVNTAGLLTFLGLFSAAFGLSVQPLVRDYFSGMIFLFEDQYNVGEKVEIFGIEGTVIDINMRTTLLRSMSGEIYIIPNGEVRVVRNFGRGEFSLASVRIAVRSTQLDEALALLETLAPTLPAQIPELLEPPKILSEEGLSERVGLTIFAKARFSQGVDARRKLMRVIHDTFTQAQIDINAA
jgi:small conductance mechanosensitive channel